MNYIFTYGSLMSGMYNHFEIEQYKAKFIKEAVLKNYQLLISAFPAIQPEKNTEVEGEIYEISDECLKYLDDMEGITGKMNFDTYKKEIINIDGYDCHIYVLDEDRDMDEWRNHFRKCPINNFKIYNRTLTKC